MITEAEWAERVARSGRALAEACARIEAERAAAEPVVELPAAA